MTFDDLQVSRLPPLPWPKIYSSMNPRADLRINPQDRFDEDEARSAR
jgi:hypothetical protein